MTLWDNKQDMDEFVRSSAHLEAMKASSGFAREIRLYTYEGTTLPSWPEAIRLLEKGKVAKYKWLKFYLCFIWASLLRKHEFEHLHHP